MTNAAIPPAPAGDAELLDLLASPVSELRLSAAGTLAAGVLFVLVGVSFAPTFNAVVFVAIGVPLYVAIWFYSLRGQQRPALERVAKAPPVERESPARMRVRVLSHVAIQVVIGAAISAAAAHWGAGDVAWPAFFGAFYCGTGGASLLATRPLVRFELEHHGTLLRERSVLRFGREAHRRRARAYGSRLKDALYLSEGSPTHG